LRLEAAGIKAAGHKVISIVAPLAGIGIGITTFATLATAKSYAPGGSFETYIQGAISRMIGPGITSAIFKPITGVTAAQLPAQGINPRGVFNSATYSGALLLGIDWLIGEFMGGKYGLSFLRPFLKSIGGGLLGGGIAGGLFDDPETPSQRYINNLPSANAETRKVLS
jgi:hypothetical protein